ncbi:MAG TPA: acyl-CoA dehydrogenase [Polyangiaceae bacterium]|nr:acyl-CoA dehydrogenase [Polyangiaceae bacterium]
MARAQHFVSDLATHATNPSPLPPARERRRGSSLLARARSGFRRWFVSAEPEPEDPISGVFLRPELPSAEDLGAEPLPSVQQLTRFLYGASAEETRFRERVKAVLASPAFERREGLSLQEQAKLSYERFRLLRDELELRVRDVVDRPSRLTSVLELVGAVDGTLFTVMSIHYCLCAGSILRHAQAGTEIEQYLAELDGLDSIGTFLVTELGYGNNVVSLETRADYDAERRELVLDTPSDRATKFMPNTGLPGVPKIGVVMARLFVKGKDHGVFPLLVRLRTAQGPCPGVSITPLGEKPGYALDNAMTSFHGVRVPKACLLLGGESTLSDDGTFASTIESRRERFLLSMEQVQLGRIGLSAVGATLIGASARIALEYATQRKTFAPRHADVSVLEYRNHQRDLFSALAYGYASRLMVGSVKARYGKATAAEHDTTFRITSAAKAHISYAVERFSRLCRERCGAAGLFEENRLSTYAAQAQGLITAEGDNQIVLIKIARQMLLGHGYTRLEDDIDRLESPLDDPQRLLGLLRTRERLLLDELRRAMAPAFLRRDLFQLWNEHINLAIETATAHTSRLVAEAFWNGTRHLHAQSPVRDLLSLFGLQEIAPHLGFLLAEGLVRSEEVKAHGKTLDRVCTRLRSSALHLAAALDLPNEILRAPLASGDYAAAYAARLHVPSSALLDPQSRCTQISSE